MKSKLIYGVIPAVMFSMGASQVWADYAPIDCSTAKDDIATLQHEKKNNIRCYSCSAVFHQCLTGLG